MDDHARNDEILTAQDVAGILKTSLHTVRRLAREGEITSFVVGREYRFRRSAVTAYLDKQNPAACGTH